MASPRSSLDLFLLALIAKGISTPYAFKAQVGLSVGASRPALERLRQAGLIKKGAPGKRGRTAYLLTPAVAGLPGNLSELIQDFKEEPPSDLESILRVSVLAWLVGGKKDLLDPLSAAEARRERDGRGDKPADIPNDAPQLYRWALDFCETRRRSAETDILANLLRAGAASPMI